MAENKTIFQKLGSTLNFDGFGFEDPKNRDKKKIIIRGDNPDDLKRKALELQQKKSLEDKFFKVTDHGFQKAMQYEAARLPAYLDYEGMEYYPLIASALDLFMEESTTIGENGKMLNIYSNNDRIKDRLDELFYDIINVNTNLPFWIRQLPIKEDSIIPLLDGTEITIKEISERLKNNPNDEIWTYSVQDKTNNIVVGKIIWCDLTRKNSTIVKVTLDDGSYVETTPDHEFMLRNGTYVQAQNLKKNDSLMPFYTRESVTPKDNINGYEKVYNPSSNQYKYTHNVVAHELHRNLLEEKSFGGIFDTHHIDFNKRNNYPKYFEESTKRQSQNVINHKVLSVEFLNEKSDVYCMEVVGKNGEHDRHNFPICSKDSNGNYTRNGIFVSNCKYGDNFVYLVGQKNRGISFVKQLVNYEMERIERVEFGKPIVKFKQRETNDEFNIFEIAHFRILGDDKYLPYGSCLLSDSYIKTSTGIKEIKDIVKGDVVYGFDINTQKLITSNVLDVVCNGEKDILKISTPHNYIKATENHKVLVYDYSINSFKYKFVSELMIGDGLVINKSDDYNENIKINKTVEIKEYCGRIYDDFTNDLKHIPDYVDKDFAKMFGFLLGDGGINFKRPYMVYFAYGIEETVNKKYISLLEKYSNKNIYLRKNNQYANGIASAIVNSKSLATVLSNMGFDGNSRTKRIPKWVYSTSKEIRKAFLDGLMDADGSVNIDKWNCKRFQIELANYELVNDIKLLAQSLGYKTGNINKRKPRKKDVIINGNKVITIADSYVIYFYESENIQTIIADINNRKSDDFIVEKIISIKPDGKGFVFDIHVDNENHNFFANNIIVHNSILNKIRRVFRQCLDSNSKIWTPDGYTKIKDLNINDNVFSYSLKDGKYFTSKVSNISNNGIKERFEIKTRHRNIIVTNDHPILIINENNEYSYKNINEIDKKIDKLVLPSIDENNVTHSIEFLKIIKSFDFKTGFSNKIIPDWVFSLPKKWKLVFIRGIFDADGCDSNGNYSSSNKGLIERLRVLSQSCNLKVGNVITHKRKGCEWSDSFNKVIDRKETYTLYIKYENETPNVDFQKITSIESIGMGEVWDIEIDNDEHNFIAEGVVVHNCVMAEDAMLTYRILRAGEKRVFKIDVGNIDEDDVESYIHKIATRFKKQQQIYPDSGQIDYTFNILGNDEDFFLPVRNANVQTGIETLQGACFALDTKIELLDGRSLELKDIINEYNDGKSLWSYSIDPKSGLIVPGKITWAGVTRKNAQVLKLTLDNGETITCTPDHKFPTKYNGKKEAKDLNIGESMWAFNKKEEKISNKKYAKPYEMIYDHSKQDWVFTHRMVANYMKEKNLHEEFTHKYVGKKGINKYWNNISEEELIIKKNIAINNSLMSRDKAVETFSNNPNRDSIIKERGKSISKTKSLKENRIKQAKHIKLRWENSNLREIIKEKQSIKYSHKLLDLLIDYVNEYNRIDLILENKINIKNSEWIEEFNVLNQNNKQLNKMSAITRNNIDKMLKYFGYLNWRDFKSKIPCYNHKIVAIEWLEDKQDTGTITIDGKEQLTDYHTFALSSGIFTLNSNLDQIHDIEYLRDNLFTGLGVPKPFLGYQQAAGDGKNMAQMDVRFAKKINRIQQATIQELNKIAIIHLMLLGFKKEEIYDFQLSLTNPSTQQDLLKTELWQQKAQVYTELTRSESGIAAMSHTNAKKFFFGWSDKDIVDDYLNQRMERAVAQELQDSPLIIRKTGLFSDIDKKYGIGDVPPEELPQAGGGQDGGGLGTEGGPEDLSGMGGGDFGSPAQLPPVESKYIYDKEGQKRLVDSVIRDSNGKKYLSERQYVDLLDRLVKNGKSATEIKETTKNIVINEELNERNQEYIKKASNLVGEIDNLLGEGKDTLNSKSIEHLRTYSEKNEENITEEFNINDIDVDSV